MCRRCVVTRVRSRQAHQLIIQTIWQDMKWTALLCPLDCCTPVFIHMLPDTHTHTAHQCNSAHAGLNNSSGQQLCVHSFSFHLVSSICPANQHTHTHTRKCTVANMCNGELWLQRCDRQRVLSAIAVPTSSHDSESLINYWLNWTSWPDRDSRSPWWLRSTFP
jgi:hypothetical protein